MSFIAIYFLILLINIVSAILDDGKAKSFYWFVSGFMFNSLLCSILKEIVK